MFPLEATSTVCLFKRATGFACPSCGSTRALLSILNGDFTEAFFLNPLGYVGLFIMIIVPAMFALDRFRKSELTVSIFSKAEVIVRQPCLAIPFVALITLNWAWNIYKGL